MHCKCKDYPTFGALSNQGNCLLCSVANTTEIFSENIFRKKKSNFLVYEKHLSYNFHIWKKVYHKDFIQFSLRMKFYVINCMTRRFGHPGLRDFETDSTLPTKIITK